MLSLLFVLLNLVAHPGTNDFICQDEDDDYDYDDYDDDGDDDDHCYYYYYYYYYLPTEAFAGKAERYLVKYTEQFA